MNKSILIINFPATCGWPHGRKHGHCSTGFIIGRQRDQMARLFFNIWPFTTMKFAQQQLFPKICYKYCQIPNKPLEKLPKTLRIVCQNGEISPNMVTLIILHNILKCGLIPASFCLASSFLTTQVESEKIVGIKSCPIFVVYKLTEGSHCSLHLIFPNSPISHYLIGPLSKIAHVIECYKSWNQF